MVFSRLFSLASLALLLLSNEAIAQDSQLPSTFPAAGMPSGPYSTAFQTYYLQNKSDPALLDAIPFINDIGRMFSGSVSVNRAGHPNDTLFFWAVEHAEGSLTQAAGSDAVGAVTPNSGLRPGMATTVAEASSAGSSEPWVIWLNGGPGASSLLGLLEENGPFIIQNDGSFAQNPYSWDKLVDMVYVDQPVGVGFATGDSEGYANDENQIAEDFVSFLSNLVAVFPSLESRPLYLTGESYAGTYIPYIAQAILSSSTPPVQLAGISLGNPSVAYFSVFEHATAVQVLKTFPWLINYNTDVLGIFESFAHVCGLDFNLTYPQTAPIPLPEFIEPTDPSSLYYTPSNPYPTRKAKRELETKRELVMRALPKRESPATPGVFANTKNPKARALVNSQRARKAEEEAKIKEWSNHLAAANSKARATDSEDPGFEFLSSNIVDGLDPYYGCDLTFMVWDYALNFSSAYSEISSDEFYSGDGLNIYDLPDVTFPKANNNPMSTLPETYFPNSDAIRAAIHAPNIVWEQNVDTIFSATNGVDPSPPPMDFLDELVSLAESKNPNFKFMFQSGNTDSLITHFGTEVTIQNTTFGGTRGFTRKPSTPLYDDSGAFAGIIHQERNFIYALVQGASHEIPQSKPETSYIIIRDFLLGNKTTGLVSAQGSPAIGGEDSSLALPYLSESPVVYAGSLSTQSTVSFPTATVDAFYAYVSSSLDA